MKIIATILIAAMTPFVLTACGGDENVESAIGASSPKVRFAHMAPLAPAVTLDRNGVSASQATNVSYGFAADYFTVDSGAANWNLKLAATGTDVGTAPIDAKNGHRYTIFAVEESLTTFGVVTIDDPTNPSLTTNDGQVRAFNAAFTAPNIDIYLLAAGEDLATQSPGFPAIAFKAAYPASGTDSVRRAGTTYTAVVTPTGSKTVLFRGALATSKNLDQVLIAVPAPTLGNPNGLRLLFKVDGQPGATEVPAS